MNVKARYKKDSWICINPKDLSLDVRSSMTKKDICFPAFNLEIGQNEIMPIIYFDVLYPDWEKKHPHRKAYLIHPEGWLLALGTIIHHAIIDGITWETIKLLLKKALEKMQNKGVAPLKSTAPTTKTKVKSEFHYIEYVSGKKQRELYLKLSKITKKSHRSRRSPKSKKT